MDGRLVEFGAIPLETDGSAEPARAMDWNLVFSAAGLDRARFQPVPPSWIPPVASDERAAWTGVFPERPDLPLRLEAAAHNGRLVAFRSFGPWPAEPPKQLSTWSTTIIADFLILVSLLLAWLNARTGRVDRRGAIRLAVPFFLLALGTWIIGGHYALAWESLQQFRHAVSQAIVGAGTTVITYLAIEPHVRRRWPTVLVSWSRVLGGRWRDSLVGRHALVGLAMGALAGVIALIGTVWGLQSVVATDSDAVLTAVLSARTTVAALMSMPLSGIGPALFWALLMLVLRTVTRGELPAVAAAVLIVSASYYAQGGAIVMTMGAVLAVLSTTCLIRFGLVSLVAYFLMGATVSVLNAAMVLNSGAGVVTLVAIVGLALGAAYVAMGSPVLPRAASRIEQT
jgi:hypothetical protein